MLQAMNASEFLDMSNPRYGIVRTAMIAPRVYQGSPIRCAIELEEELQKVYQKGTQIAVAPEMYLAAGYSVQDLVHTQDIQRKSKQAVNYVKKASKHWNMIIIVGGIFKYESVIYNVVYVIRQGKILAIIPKLDLPNSLEFIEGKHFTSGEGIQEVIWVDFLEEVVPFSPYVLIDCTFHPDCVIAPMICEDLWGSKDKGSDLSVCGATIFPVPSASPDHVLKESFVKNLCNMRSYLYFGAILWVSSGEGESSDSVVMSGRRIASQGGETLICEDRYDDRRKLTEIVGATIVDIDLQMIAHDRQIDSTFRANVRRHQQAAKVHKVKTDGKLGIDESEVYFRLYRTIEAFPFVPVDPVERKRRAREIRDICVGGLIDRIQNTGIEHVQIGISGGIDSLQALTICLEAFDILGLPRTNIHAVTMPGLATGGDTYDRAMRTLKYSGVSRSEIPIGKIALSLLDAIGHDGVTENITYENAFADVRKDILYLQTSDKGYPVMVIGTSGLLEILLGHCTKGADQFSDWDPNASLPKTQIKYVALEYAYEIEPVNPDFAKVCIDTAYAQPTADLKTGQHTEDLLGPLEILDFYIWARQRWGMEPMKALRLAVASGLFEMHGYEQLKKSLGIYLRRRIGNHHKTIIPMPGPMIGTVSANTTKVLQMSSDMGRAAYEEVDIDLDELPSSLSIFD